MGSLGKRLISATIIISAVVSSVLWLPAVGWWLLASVIVSICILEYYKLLDQADIPVFRIVGLVCGLALIGSCFLNLTLHASGVPDVPSTMGATYAWMVYILFMSVIAILIRQFPQKHNEKPLETIACTLLGIFYVPLLFSFLALLAFGWGLGTLMDPIGPTGQKLLLYLVVVTKITDVGAFFTGSLIGKHKLVPHLSPGKTWEGVVGGITFATIASIGIYFALGGEFGSGIHMRLYDAIVLGVFLGVVGVVGDLAESLLKRGAGAKDSGGFIPGMSGLLDVMDSLLFTAPLLYIYTRLVLTS